MSAPLRSRLAGTGAVALFLLVFLPGMPFTADAQQAVQVDFTISPPPLSWHAFEQGVLEVKARASYASVDSAVMNMRGGGIDGIFRTVTTDRSAGSLQLGVFSLRGKGITIGADAGTTALVRSELDLTQLLFGGTFEYQPLRRKRASAILFAGPAASFLFGSLSQTVVLRGAVNWAYLDEPSVYGTLYGMRGGAQAGISAGDLHIDVFGMLMRQRGSTTIAASLMDLKSDVPNTRITSFGMDLIYLPWGLTLSSIVQDQERNGARAGVTTRIHEVSWRF